MHVSTGVQRGQTRAWDLLELELNVIVSCPKWVLGTDGGSSTIAVNAFKC